MAAWTLLLVAGQAAALTLIRAGRVVGYQHYDFAKLWSGAVGKAAVLVIIGQGVALLWAARTVLRPFWRRVPTWVQAIALLVLLTLSAAPSLDVTQYAAELGLAFGVQTIAILNVVCIARSAPDRLVTRWQQVGDYWLGTQRSDQPVSGRFFDRTATIAACWTFGAALFLVVVVYQRIPHLPDEIVYELQAKYLAAGQLALPAPPAPSAFDVDLMYVDESRWFSMAPPGWPGLLALGALAGVTWLVNPVLAALAVLLVHAVLREIYAPRPARGATLLFAVSPWLLFLGMSLMTHVASLVFALIAALGVARARRTGQAWPTFIGGLAIGVVSLIRPLEGLAVALILGVWSLGARGRGWRLTPSVTLVLGTLLSAALVAPYNAALTGSASRFPFALYSDKYYAPGVNDLGFGPNRGLGWGSLDPFPGHGWKDVIVNSVLNGVTINTELFGWITGSLVLVALLLVLRRQSRADWWMLAVIAVVVGLHAFYWFGGGPDFAGRYWFFVIVPLCALTASGVRAAAQDAATRARISLGVAALSLSAMLTFMPWRAIDKYWHYRRMEPGIARLAEQHQMNGALVLVRGPRHPDYHGAAIFNPLDLRGERTVFVWDRNRAVRAEAVRAYAGRPVWIVDGPTVTRRGYELRAGPLPPGSLAPDLPPSEELQDLTNRDRSR
ncbi:MAG: ArnT family glycosyltransferase [Gemmatimonadaceae bacterium]